MDPTDATPQQSDDADSQAGKARNAGKDRRSPIERLQALKRALDVSSVWPAKYVFKFIIPAGEQNHLLALLDGFPYSTRESRSGRYISVTCEVEMPSSEAVIEVYQRTAGVRGLMSL